MNNHVGHCYSTAGKQRLLCGVFYAVRTVFYADSTQVFLVSSVFKQMLRWFPSSMLLLGASHAVLPT
jgi:hypothetical protein